MAEASPTITCALFPTVTDAPDVVFGPEPIIVVHGEGEWVSQVVALLTVVQLACTCDDSSVMYASTARQAAVRRGHASPDTGKRFAGLRVTEPPQGSVGLILLCMMF